MNRLLSFLWTLTVLCGSILAAENRTQPNLVLILADDMGFGDVHALNPESQIPTPNLDRLAASGMTFTDGHSPSAVCTPTRYGLLTGRYAWRTRLKSGVLGGYSPPLIDPNRSTIATMFKANGYHTGAIGKWHLGMSLPMKRPGADASVWQGDPRVDFAGVITDSPIHHGFDYYFGVAASLDMAPYVFVRNDRFTMVPTLKQPAVPFPHFIRAGPRATDFIVDQVLDRLTEEAVGFIHRAAKGEQPFFLYLPLTAPHKPTQPHERFRGKTKLSEYGDFVAQVDWTVGQVLAAVDEAGVTDETMVVYTSDNGSYMFRYDDPAQSDHVDDSSIQGYRADRHRANGPFRGTKADIWEAGHRVPLLVRWPGRIEPGSKCDATVCLTDFYATFADVTGSKLEATAAEDSCSLLPMLRGEDVDRAAPVIHHSANGMFAIRAGKWKLVLGNGSGGRENPRGKPFAEPYRLFDMSTDIGERIDVAAQHPQKVAELSRLLDRCRTSGRSTPTPDRPVLVPRITGPYIHVYQPGPDVFPGPNTTRLKAGQRYDDWQPNDHAIIKGPDNRWHAFGITHPYLPGPPHHEGEFLAFHAASPPGDLRNNLREHAWQDLPKILPPEDRPGEIREFYAPYVVKEGDEYWMFYSPGSIRYATSLDLVNWTPKGELFHQKGAGRDPTLFRHHGRYYMLLTAGTGRPDYRPATPVERLRLHQPSQRSRRLGMDIS